MELPVQLCRTKTIGEFEGILEPELRFMERWDVLITRSVHSVSASGGRTLARVLNPSNAPVTVYQDEKLGVLQPLGISLESAALEEADPYPQSHREEAKQTVRHLQSRVQGLSEAENTALETLLFNFPDVISLNSSDLGRTNVVRHRIDTQGATPIRQPPRRLPFHQRDLVKKLLDDMLEQKIVEPASGPWASPIVLVTKKDGTPRFCVDYRRINSLTKKDAHPLPRIDDTLDQTPARSTRVAPYSWIEAEIKQMLLVSKQCTLPWPHHLRTWRGNRSSEDTVCQRVANSNLQVCEELCSDCCPSLPPIREKEGVDME